MNLRPIFSSLFKSALVAMLCLAPLGLAHAKAIEGVVNVNTATVQELSLLPGVGKAKAEQIVQLRQSKPFAAIEDLKAVKGLGAKRLEAMRSHIVFSGDTTAKVVKTPKPESAASASSNPAPNPKS